MHIYVIYTHIYMCVYIYTYIYMVEICLKFVGGGSAYGLYLQKIPSEMVLGKALDGQSVSGNSGGEKIV